MNAIFGRLGQWAEALLVAICITAFVAMIGTLAVQVVSRHLIVVPLLWASEAGQIAFNVIVFVGGLLAVARGDLISMDGILDRLSGVWPDRIRLFHGLLLAGVAVYLIPTGWQIVSTAMRFSLGMTGLPLAVIYIPGAIFLTCVPLGIWARHARTSPRKEDIH